MLGHDNGSINRLKPLINKAKVISSHLGEFPGIAATLIAKVRVDGSNPFARSNFCGELQWLAVFGHTSLPIAR